MRIQIDVDMSNSRTVRPEIVPSAIKSTRSTQSDVMSDHSSDEGGIISRLLHRRVKRCLKLESDANIAVEILRSGIVRFILEVRY